MGREGRVREGQDRNASVIDDQTQHPEILNNLGTVYAKLGDKANALASYEKAVTLRPNYAIARYNLAEAYEPTNPKRALSEYETYLALVEGIPDEAGRIAVVQQRVKVLKR